ncbi:hypothetical protein TBLA_0A05880 [Henningerozyma blattae CBS 6284]|uniref:Uncharacterized protein n=1 Tax=Henningerozyma blattae (strain ATCC 34711 / CBS 6284 / DSM 70876 / NBRC 10599 / NRRL Y-10934 / UCD 77-7) TaxID=1071380 RepID=I2GW79_HENB6|nr:hypothetical protein TBLA_0A05880 [Tetrapisispora blattae CBS 6284]CCH58381.1 hypothetical protein TBLA_0A05880 [Tetrapisispora blattae CBS 6284]
MSEQTVEYNFKTSSIENPTEIAHLVPCIIHFNGQSDEIKTNLKFDQEEEKNHTNKFVTYFRGRKLIGQDVLKLLNENNKVKAFVMEDTTNIQNNKQFHVVSTLDKVINYEREGNEDRLDMEMSKLREFIDVTNLIHS